MIDPQSMRQLDTGALVTLKQRIERELMRRGDVEQSDTPAPERMTKAEWTELYLRGELTVDVPVGYLSEPGHYRIGGLQRVSEESQSRFSNVTCETLPTDALSSGLELVGTTIPIVMNNDPAPIAQRQLLREPDPGCTRCWGRGIKLTSDLTVTGFVTQLCPCLWGGG